MHVSVVPHLSQKAYPGMSLERKDNQNSHLASLEPLQPLTTNILTLML